MPREDFTWQEMNDPWNEWQTADLEELQFEQDQMNDDLRNDWIEDRDDWWKSQDEEMQRIEIQAEMEELRHNGYGE